MFIVISVMVQNVINIRSYDTISACNYGIIKLILWLCLVKSWSKIVVSVWKGHWSTYIWPRKCETIATNICTSALVLCIYRLHWFIWSTSLNLYFKRCFYLLSFIHLWCSVLQLKKDPRFTHGDGERLIWCNPLHVVSTYIPAVLIYM